MTTLLEQTVTIDPSIASELIIKFQPNMPSQTCTPCTPCPAPETVPKKKTSDDVDKKIDLLILQTATIEQCIKTSTGNVTTALRQVELKEKELDALKKQMEVKQREVEDAKIKFAREHKELDIDKDKMNKHQESLELRKEEKEKLVLEEKADREKELKEADEKIAAFSAKH